MKKIFILISILSLSLLLQACPGFVINKIEEREATLDSLRKSHSPNYISKSIKYSTFAKADSSKSSISEELEKIEYSIKITSTNTTEYPQKITIDFIIADTNGRYLTNLAPPYNMDYKAIWEGLSDSCGIKKSVIKNVEIEEIQTDNSPKYAIAFLLDHSPSMGNDRITKLQKGVIDLVQYLKEPDMVSIAKFTSKLYNSVHLTRDKFSVLNSFRIDSMYGIDSRGTYYFDAINTGIEQLKNAPDDYEKIIIAFTDGGDTGSELKSEDVSKRLKSNNVKLFNVGFGYADSEVLNSLSEASKGKFYMTVSSKEFPYVLRDIYLKLSNYYRVTYEVEDCIGTHNVTIPINLANKYSKLIGKTTYTIVDTNKRNVGDIVFLNIEFVHSESAITDAKSLDEIRKIANWMDENKQFKILIKGHTDNSGELEFNQELSLKRANAVRDELVKLGIDKSRMNVFGFGSSKPLVPNDSEANKQKNRRTEIEVVE